MTNQRLAKGQWQASILEELLAGRNIINPISCLQGKAKNWSLSYQRSFNALLDRLNQAGYQIECTAGVRGGMWGAHYRIINH
jgi:hypothetical protein